MMYVKQLSLIFLLAFISIAWADFNLYVEITDKSEEQNVTEDVFHLSKTCASDSDCHNFGKCKAETGGKFCNCKNGTSGDFCEKVVECVDNPAKCGTSKDVSCEFDGEKEKAVCKCANENKTYVKGKRSCSSPCVNYYDCGQYGSCFHIIGNKKFCACILGASGDFCEIIDQCHSKEVDCGVDNNATCTLGGDGKAYCNCDNKTMGFDYDEKICKGCEGCGENIYSAGACSYNGGIRRCYCKLRYYSNKNGTCEDCKCGQNSYGCNFENGTKTCLCWGGNAHKDGYCEKCDCGGGLGVSNCEFKDGKEVCSCKDGYALAGPSGPCKQMCNATNQCENGGKCAQNMCKCLKGTSGDFCKTIDDCGRKCGSADCLYNVTSKEAYCKCAGSLVFDDSSKTCKECDCGDGIGVSNCEFKDGKKVCSCKDGYALTGPNGLCKQCNCGSYMKSCAFVDGKKRCNCTSPLYADRLGTCKFCYCKGFSNTYGCKFSDNGKLQCPCMKGYAQYEDECKTCDCGDHGTCFLYGPYSKFCTCDEGYSEYNGKCEACNCGKYGKCFFFQGKPACSCDSGYVNYLGTCKACKCEVNAICGFNDSGTPVCTCMNGYGLKQGVCTACNCGGYFEKYGCKFISNGKKKCSCLEKYADDNGKCSACDCKVEGSKCTFKSDGFNRCQCPVGYEEKSDPDSAFNKICVEMDVCQKANPCPPSSTICTSGKLGSYECVCKPGYEALYVDLETYGCQDINECATNYKPCDDERAKCINTQGSYKCHCYSGYIRRDKEEEKRNLCHYSSPSGRPWRIGSIIVGVSSAIIIIGLLFAVCHKYGSE